jgi:tetratricopeptide (TPR) repeat protein
MRSWSQETGQRSRRTRDLFVTGAVSLLAFLLIAGFLLAGESESSFARGNHLYADGDFQGAIQAYESILKQGYESWQVYYNLGNAYYKSGELGKAILNYERARRLNPRNEDIGYNLELANLRVVDRVNAIPDLFFVRWLKVLVRLFPAATLGWLALAFYAVAAGLWIARMFATPRRLRVLVTGLLIPALAVVVFATALVSYRIYLDGSDRYAIVLAEKVDAYSAPENGSTHVFALHEGTKVLVEGKENGWSKIRLGDGKIGWIPSTSIQSI